MPTVPSGLSQWTIDHRSFSWKLLIGLVFLMSLGTAGARAEPVTDTLEGDVALLSEKLSTDSTLSGFGSFSATEKAEIERAIAFEKWEADSFTSTSSALESNLNSTLFKSGSAADTAISADESAISSGASALPDTGSAVEAIGGEALDVAADGLSLTAPLTLIPLAAALGYQDITTGTNSVYVALFGASEDKERFESEENGAEIDVAAEKLAWVYFPRMPNCTAVAAKSCTEVYEHLHTKCPGGGPAFNVNLETWSVISGNCEFYEHTNRFGENQETRTGQVYHAGTELPNPFATRSMYVLEPEIGKIWYLGSVAGRLKAWEIPGGAITTELAHWTTDTLACLSGGSGVGSVAGYPSQVGPEILIGSVQEHFCLGEGRGLYYATATVRSPSRFHDGLPRHLTKGEEEALEAGGHGITHLTGKELIGSELAAATKTLLETLEKGGERRLEEAAKHWFEGISPETPLPGTAEVVSCAGVGPVCKTAMEEAGFANVHLHTLEWKNANLAIAPGDVTTISPAPKTYAELSQEIIITQNPSAEQVENTSEAWAEKNPESELTTEQRKVLAAECLKTADKGGYGLSECDSVPIFIPGSDISTATAHDKQAIETEPKWIRLNYESAAAKKANGEKRGNVSPGCSGPKEVGEQCDEYPYFASMQGGSTHSPSLEWVNGEDNANEGNRYATFLGKCEIIEYGPFFVVPTQAIPSTYLCNK